MTVAMEPRSRNPVAHGPCGMWPGLDPGNGGRRAMELRLTVSEAGGRVVIQVDGRLSQAGVPELERACRHAPRPLVLDLTGLVSLDDVGIATLRRLRGDGVELTGPSPYVKLLLTPKGPA